MSIRTITYIFLLLFPSQEELTTPVTLMPPQAGAKIHSLSLLPSLLQASLHISLPLSSFPTPYYRAVVAHVQGHGHFAREAFRNGNHGGRDCDGEEGLASISQWSWSVTRNNKPSKLI